MRFGSCISLDFATFLVCVLQRLFLRLGVMFFSLLLGLLFLSLDFRVFSLDVLGVDHQAHHLRDVCIESESSQLPWSLHACALLRETSTPRPWSWRPRSPRTTYVLVTKSFFKVPLHMPHVWSVVAHGAYVCLDGTSVFFDRK